jgi:hypothetical protein
MLTICDCGQIMNSTATTMNLTQANFMYRRQQERAPSIYSGRTHNALSASKTKKWGMIVNWKGFGRNWSYPNRINSGTSVEGLMKTMKNLVGIGGVPAEIPTRIPPRICHEPNHCQHVRWGQHHNIVLGKNVFHKQPGTIMWNIISLHFLVRPID